MTDATGLTGINPRGAFATSFHIEAPPPVESPDLMLRNLTPDLRDGIKQFGCPSVSFRYKIWWIWTYVTKVFCNELGLHFIQGPTETRDSNGFLDVRYYLDGVHGNDEYGELIAQELAKAMRTLGSVAGGLFDETKHEFINLRVSDVRADLADTVDFIRLRNANARFILTVSPVPLIVTMENRSVLASITYSKSVLWVAERK
jgi:hypothetical protein